jgi:8-oxo-dGTP pyrophosphatase MutT (NUDIX family)
VAKTIRNPPRQKELRPAELAPMAEVEAAVAIVHARGAEESVLLIRRTEREDDPWSGHWSFPGGRREPEDEDLVETALRELAEECGIVLARESLEACFPVTMAGRRVGRVMQVAPFLFRAAAELPAILDKEEAAEAIWIPLSLLRDPSRHCLTPVPRQPRERIFPAIELNGVPLWGFTYRVLTEWLCLHGADSLPEKPGFRSACLLLEFLLANGMEMRHPWRDHGSDPQTVKIAGVTGEIPVAAVLARFSMPENQIPAFTSIEILSDSIRVMGLDREEYVIEAVP